MANVSFPCFGVKAFLQFSLTAMEDKSQKHARSHFSAQRSRVSFTLLTQHSLSLQLTPDSGRWPRSKWGLGSSVLSETHFTSEKGITVCGCGRNWYIKIQCLDFIINWKFPLNWIIFYFFFLILMLYLLKVKVHSYLGRTNESDYTALNIWSGT